MNHGLDTGFLIAIEVPEHPEHHAARSKIAALIPHGERLSGPLQVLAEFIHVVTDSRRFTQPLPIDDARNLALQWRSAAEVDHAFPNAAAPSSSLIGIECTGWDASDCSTRGWPRLITKPVSPTC